MSTGNLFVEVTKAILRDARWDVPALRVRVEVAAIEAREDIFGRVLTGERAAALVAAYRSVKALDPVLDALDAGDLDAATFWFCRAMETSVARPAVVKEN